MTTFIDFHVIQNLPPSNVNRDDTGMPKSAVYGGVSRVRVSSQSWKRATRRHFSEGLDESGLGKRTKRVVEIVAREIASLDPELADRAEELAEEVFKAAKIKLTLPKGKSEEEAAKESGYLLFLSSQQVKKIAQLAVDAASSGEGLDKKAVKSAFNEGNSIDIALFGRMVAENAELNVDASCQVAHAISTHQAENEFDFFTAVDDEKDQNEEEEDAGAGMMGTVGFTSATMYRFATINVNQLEENLGDAEATLRAITSFAEGFIQSMPTGKVNTFANFTLPELVAITIRDDQPISLASAFENPVSTKRGGYIEESISRLTDEKARIEDAYGKEPIASYVVSVSDSDEMEKLGERIKLTELDGRIRDIVSPRLVEEE